MTAHVPTRQVHLDFHTSEHITGIGERFRKDEFQDALRAGRLNQINLFAKCHHGWSYYPTQVGAMHPHLNFDLLGAQIEACHEIGVAAPIYYTVGWSVRDAELHPEWCVHDKEGRLVAINTDFDAQPDDPRPGTSWIFLCPSGGYLEQILAQTEEICRTFDVDGLWYDINDGPYCYCDDCRAGMQAEGVSVDDAEQVWAYNVRKWERMMRECNRVLHAHHPNATVFYNGTTVLYSPDERRPTRADTYRFNTQQELEDLPTTWGGYDKLMQRAKFFHNRGQDLLAMSGKFHTSWGEFGGFKHADALRYEAASMIAYGAACNFGDQLHPSGQMDAETYRLIGEAYAYVEQIEEYGVGGRPYSRLGLWRTLEEADDEGVSRILLEAHLDYAVVDPAGDLSAFDVIVMTGAPGLDPEAAVRLETYVQDGGKLLVLGESALEAGGDRFLLDVGATYLGPANYATDYLLVGRELGDGLVTSPFFNYTSAIRTQPDAGAETLAKNVEPYFDRTYATYCSHLNTPNGLEAAEHPGAVRKGNVLFLPHRLGAIYFAHGARLHRDLVVNALRTLYTKPTVEANLPSAARISLLHQPEHKRYVAHLLYAPPLQRGRCLVIEDLPPVYDATFTVRLPETVTGIRTVPELAEGVIVEEGEGAIAVTVPRFQCHQAVVFAYE